MKREQLIEELQKLPEGIEVCVFDWRMNLHDDSGDGSSAGIYSDFNIAVYGEDEIVEDTIPFATLEINNDDYNNDGTLC
jgi:hypothetical protein